MAQYGVDGSINQIDILGNHSEYEVWLDGKTHILTASGMEIKYFTWKTDRICFACPLRSHPA